MTDQAQAQTQPQQTVTVADPMQQFAAMMMKAMQQAAPAANSSQNVLPVNQDPEFAARIEAASMHRKKAILAAARNLGPLIPDTIAPAVRAAALSRLGMLDWQHHNKRQRYDFRSGQKASRLQRGFTTDAPEVQQIDDELVELSDEMEDIEVLATAAELQFEDAVAEFERATGREYTGRFSFDISDVAFDEWRSKDAGRRIQNAQQAAQAGRNADDALRRTMMSSKLEQLANGDDPS